MIIFSSANKDYKAKLRSLSFNLKKNSMLRKDVLNGLIPVDRLCRYPSSPFSSFLRLLLTYHHV